MVPIRRIREEHIVTGEAVELDIHPASPMLRILATASDMVLTLLAVLVTVIFVMQNLGELSTSQVRIFSISVTVCTVFLIPAAVELVTRGQSLGKWAFGIRVVRDDGGVVTARHVAMRHLVGILEVWLLAGGLALMSSLVSPTGKRLGDMAAGTMVVRVPEAMAHSPVIMPLELAQWALSSQILPLSADLQADALGFLRTNRTYAPQVRLAAANRIAERIQARVYPGPPEGTHPERFIAAVLVVLRDREYLRMQARDRRGQARRVEVGARPFGL